MITDVCKARILSPVWFIIVERTDSRAVFKRLLLMVKADGTVHVYPAKLTGSNIAAYW